MEATNDRAPESSIEALRAILDAVRHIVQVMRTFSTSTESELGLTAAQLFALQVIGRHAPLTVNELAARTFTHQSSVSVVVRRLGEKSLVTKTPSARDRRRVELAPTRKGLKLLERAPAAAQDRLIAALEVLAPADRDQLAALLNQVVRKLEPSGRAPSMFFEGEPESGPGE